MVDMEIAERVAPETAEWKFDAARRKEDLDSRTSTGDAAEWNRVDCDAVGEELEAIRRRLSPRARLSRRAQLLRRDRPLARRDRGKRSSGESVCPRDRVLCPHVLEHDLGGYHWATLLDRSVRSRPVSAARRLAKVRRPTPDARTGNHQVAMASAPAHGRCRHDLALDVPERTRRAGYTMGRSYEKQVTTTTSHPALGWRFLFRANKKPDVSRILCGAGSGNRTRISSLEGWHNKPLYYTRSSANRFRLALFRQNYTK